MRCQPLLPLNGGLRFGHQKGDRPLKELATMCAYCGVKFKHGMLKTTDHVIPKMKHGRSAIDNYLITCDYCNNLKGSKTLGAFLNMYPQAKQHIREYLASFTDKRGLDYVNRVTQTIRHCVKGVI